MENCIFCRIVKGEIPAAKIYEDELVFAFLDIAPINFGHVLVEKSIRKALADCGLLEDSRKDNEK